MRHRPRAEAARRAVAELSDREEADRLTARLGRIDTAQRDLDRVAGQLRAIALTDRGFGDIETAAAAVDLARAQVDLTAPTVAFTADVRRRLGHRWAADRRCWRGRRTA